MKSFFFQAEDGIRDDLVTGVQTCALPICRRLARGGTDGDRDGRRQPLRLADRQEHRWLHRRAKRPVSRDRKSVVEGKGGDLGGRRIIKKKKKAARDSNIHVAVKCRRDEVS